MRLKRYGATVKQHPRKPFSPAHFFVLAPSRAEARARFAFIFDAPLRWVRVQEA
jgi:hypothetical protein